VVGAEGLSLKNSLTRWPDPSKGIRSFRAMSIINKGGERRRSLMFPRLLPLPPTSFPRPALMAGVSTDRECGSADKPCGRARGTQNTNTRRGDTHPRHGKVQAHLFFVITVASIIIQSHFRLIDSSPHPSALATNLEFFSLDNSAWSKHLQTGSAFRTFVSKLRSRGVPHSSKDHWQLRLVGLSQRG